MSADVSEKNMPELALLAKRGSTDSPPPERFSESDVADLLLMSTTRSTEVKGETTPRRTTKRSAENTTTTSTEFSGTEPLDYVLSLPSDMKRKWVVMRLAAYQESMVLYATVAQQAKERGKSVSEAEWEAILATDGITRAVPQEQHIYEWIMRGD